MSAPVRSEEDLDRHLLEFKDEIGEVGPVAVEGRRTRWEAGGEPVPGTRLVRAPAAILEHRPAEMTARVRAGTTVAELHLELGEAGQRSALPDRGGTVGGALAVGENDVCVLGVGRVRDAPLRLRYVSAEGRIVTAGGPTVKNVSGYDLPRLLVGSLGTLGAIAEVTLRTNPLPACSSWWLSEDADPFAALETVYRPSAVLWDGSRTWVRLEGHPEDVVEQRLALEHVGDWAESDRPPPLPPHRWSLRPLELRHLDPGQVGDFVASIGVGTVFASRPQPRSEPPPALAALNARMKSNFDPTGRMNPGRRTPED